MGTQAISAEEGLFLLVPWLTVSDDDLTVRLVADVRAFTAAFGEVWRRVPPQVRHLLLGHWRGRTAAGGNCTGVAEANSHPRPLIRLLSDDELAEDAVAIRRLGRELAFRADVIKEPRERLRSVIARTLAEVYRLANREHGMLVERLLLLPLEKWEQAHLAGASDAEYDAIQAALEAEFLARHEAAVGGVLRRWGFAAQAVPR